MGEEGENGERRRKGVGGIKKGGEKKGGRERDEFNVMKGRKKCYVLELSGKGFEVDRVIGRMKKKLGEGNEKCMNVWYRMGKRNINGKGKGK